MRAQRFALVVACLLVASISSGAVTLIGEVEEFNGAGTYQLDFILQNDNVGREIAGIVIPIDLSLPLGFTFDVGTPASSFDNPLGFDTFNRRPDPFPPPLNQSDIIFDAAHSDVANNTVLLPNQEVVLFSMLFTADATAVVPSTVELATVESAHVLAPITITTNLGDLLVGDFIFQPGLRLQPAAVPEPTSIALLGFLTGGLLVRRRR